MIDANENQDLSSAAVLNPEDWPTPIARILAFTIDSKNDYRSRFPAMISTVEQALRFAGILMISEYFAKIEPSRSRPEFTRFFSNLRTPHFGDWGRLLEHFFTDLTTGEKQKLRFTRDLEQRFDAKVWARVKAMAMVRVDQFAHRNAPLSEDEAKIFYEKRTPDLTRILEAFNHIRNGTLYYRAVGQTDGVWLCKGTKPSAVRAEAQFAGRPGLFSDKSTLLFSHGGGKNQQNIPVYPFFEMDTIRGSDLMPILFNGWREHQKIWYMGDKDGCSKEGPFAEVEKRFKNYGIPFPFIPLDEEISLSSLSGFSNCRSRRRIDSLRNRKYFPDAYVARPGIDDRVEEFIDSGSEPILLVVSKAGMGKTSLLCHIAERALGDEEFLADGTNTVVFIDFRGDQSIWQSTQEHMGLAGSGANGMSDLLAKWATLIAANEIAKPRLVFVLDALDEGADLIGLLAEVGQFIDTVKSINRNEMTRNGVKVIVSLRKHDFERARPEVLKTTYNAFPVSDSAIVELSPFTEQQASQAFMKLGLNIARTQGRPSQCSWKLLSEEIKALLKDPILIWIYHTVFSPTGKRLAPEGVSEQVLWKGFFDHCLRYRGAEAGSAPDPKIRGFFVNTLMPYCYDSKSIEITNEMTAYLADLAAKRPRDAEILPFDELVSRGLLFEHTIKTYGIEQGISYTFVHRRVAEHALCMLFRQDSQRFGPLDFDFFDRQLQIAGSFDGLRGALLVLLVEQWEADDLTSWTRALATQQTKEWIDLLTDALSDVASRSLVRLNGNTASEIINIFCRKWEECIQTSWENSHRCTILSVAGAALAHKLDEVSRSHQLQIPTLEPLCESLTDTDVAACTEAVTLMLYSVGTSWSTRGNRSRAAQLLERAREFAENASSGGESPWAPAILGKTLGALGKCRMLMGQRDQGLKMWQQQLALAVGDYETEQTSESRRRLAGVYDQIADHLSATGSRLESRQYREKVLEIWKSLAEQEPNDNEIRYKLANAYYDMASSYLGEGNRSYAWEMIQEDMRLAEELVSASPGTLKYQNGLAGTYSALSNLYDDIGELEKALEYRLKDLEIAERIAALDKDNVSYQSGLATSCGSLSLLYKDTGGHKKALEYRLKNLAIRERIAALDKDNVSYQSGLATSYGSLSLLYKDIGEREKALEYRLKNLEIRERIAALDKDNVSYQNGLAGSYSALSNLYDDIGEREKALEYRLKNLEIRERIAALDKDNVSYQNGLAGSYSALSNLYDDIGEREKALEYRLKDLEIAERIAARDKDNVSYQNGLATSYSALSFLYKDMGEREKALEYRLKDLDISRHVAGQDRTKILYQSNLAVTLARLAELHLGSHDLPAARQCLDEAASIRKSITVEHREAITITMLDRTADLSSIFAKYWRTEGNPEKELSYLKDEAEVRESIIQKCKGKHADSIRDLPECCERIAELAQGMGNNDLADEYRHKAMRLKRDD